MTTCVFCRIASGEESARIVYEGEYVTAFRDQNPQAPTHILILPNEHVESVDAVESGDEVWLGRLFLVARQLAEDEGLDSGYRLVVNTGAEAGQSIHHLHMHLLGGRPLSWPPG